MTSYEQTDTLFIRNDLIMLLKLENIFEEVFVKVNSAPEPKRPSCSLVRDLNSCKHYSKRGFFLFFVECIRIFGPGCINIKLDYPF